MGGEPWGVGEIVEIQPIGRGMTQAWLELGAVTGQRIGRVGCLVWIIRQAVVCFAWFVEHGDSLDLRYRRAGYRCSVQEYPLTGSF